MSWVQQRRVMNRASLRAAVEDVLSKMVPEGRRGPDESMLRKADMALDEIMGFVDQYAPPKG